MRCSLSFASRYVRSMAHSSDSVMAPMLPCLAGRGRAQFARGSIPAGRSLMELSSTSFALLGLLAVRPWTTYELAHQTKRSLRFFFPRAERHLYAEAKRLADAGLARSEHAFTGKRRSTRYSITAEGSA